VTRRAYEFRCYPTDEQKQILARTFGGCRWVYNWALRLKSDAYREAGKRLSSGDPSALLPTLKQQPETAWLAEVSSIPLQQSLHHLDRAFIVLYARVSGHDQRLDLERQIERLSAWAKAERPGSEVLVLSDIGSGLNAASKRLQQLLKLVCEDRVAEVAVTYGGRLTRFGQEYLETLFTNFGVASTVLDLDEEKTPEQELTEDLLLSIASFASKLYGTRSHKQKELIECAESVLHNP
jgi:putative resolvase